MICCLVIWYWCNVVVIIIVDGVISLVMVVGLMVGNVVEIVVFGVGMVVSSVF